MEKSKSIEMNMIRKNSQLQMSHYQRLEEQHGLRIEERFDWVKGVSGSLENKSYEIFALYGEQILFRTKLETTTFAKGCLGGSCRPFRSSVISNDSEGINTFISVERPCALSCCFFDLPQAYVYSGSKEQSNLLGRIREVFSLTQKCFEIKYQDTLKYKINANCMQCELLCCDSCVREKMDIDFDIMNSYGEHVGAVKKRVPKQSLANKIIEVHFPTDASKEDKALLLSFVIFLENRFF